MKIVILLLIVGFIVWRMLPTKGIRTATVDELRDVLKDKSKQFIDVRTKAEYKARHIKQFKNIPLGEIRSKAASLDNTKETFLICQSGMRSSQAAKQLKKAGFENVINVRGGMGAWRE